jgi:hypothetical protein
MLGIAPFIDFPEPGDFLTQLPFSQKGDEWLFFRVPVKSDLGSWQEANGHARISYSGKASRERAKETCRNQLVTNSTITKGNTVKAVITHRLLHPQIASAPIPPVKTMTKHLIAPTVASIKYL